MTFLRQVLVGTAALLFTGSPATAYHDTLGIASVDSAMIGFVLPLVVLVIVGMVGLGLWGRRKKGKRTRRRRRKLAR